jgi:thymidylate synthase (FAD)
LDNPFRAEVVAAYERPQQAIFVALHNDYAEDFHPDTELPEDRCGEIAVKRLLEGKRGHWGPLEHAHLTLLLKLDHNTVVQLRTHRLMTFDVQSMRYTGIRVERVAREGLPVESVFYFRPPGVYSDRNGSAYRWSEADVEFAKAACQRNCVHYANLRANGVSEEHARYVLPTSYFQNVCITGNARSWLHLLDVRLKLDAQLEIRWAMELVSEKISKWIPEIYSCWESQRKGKAILAP